MISVLGVKAYKAARNRSYSTPSPPDVRNVVERNALAPNKRV